MKTQIAELAELRATLLCHDDKLRAVTRDRRGARGDRLIDLVAETNVVVEEVAPVGQRLSFAVESPAIWEATATYYDAWRRFSTEYDDAIEAYSADKKTPGVVESLDVAYRLWDDAHHAVRTVLEVLDAEAEHRRIVGSQYLGDNITVHGPATFAGAATIVNQTMNVTWQVQASRLVPELSKYLDLLEKDEDRAQLENATGELQSELNTKADPARIRRVLEKIKRAATSAGIAAGTAAASEAGKTVTQQIASVLRGLSG